MRSVFGRVLASFAVFVILLVAARGQSQRASVPDDPYTDGKPELLQAAGYVAVSDFACGAHTTKEVDELLGDEPLCWIETAHFRIGCALSPAQMSRGSRDWKKMVKVELRRLSAKLPRVKRSARTLDPWLRAHLVAQRLEDCYAEVQELLGVSDTDFPAEPMDPTVASTYFGQGPYLGMKEKFNVILVQRMASNARYTRKFCGREAEHPMRLFDAASGALGVVMSEEYNKGQLQSDHVLHVHLTYNVVINLLNGFRSFGHPMPAWVQLGVGHWYARRISPRFPVYETKSEEEREGSDFWKWDDRALGLMKHDVFEPIEELVARHDVTAFGMEQHIQAWFLADYLLHQKPAETRRFLRSFSDPMHGRSRSPTPAELSARQRQCFEAAFGGEPAELEAAWRAGTRRLAHRKR